MGFLDWPEAGMIGDPDACPNHDHCPDCGVCYPASEGVTHEWDCEIKPPDYLLTTLAPPTEEPPPESQLGESE